MSVIIQFSSAITIFLSYYHKLFNRDWSCTRGQGTPVSRSYSRNCEISINSSPDSTFINKAYQGQFVVILENCKITTTISTLLCTGSYCKQSLTHERVLLFSGQYFPYSGITIEQKKYLHFIQVTVSSG